LNGQNQVAASNPTQFYYSNGTLEYDNLPAGTPWNVEFDYNFTTNSAYQNQYGLLTPLKPACWDMANLVFPPLSYANIQSTAAASGGYFSICHPEANEPVAFTAGEQTSLSLNDSWYGYFSYIPYDQYTNELGHLYGIRNIRFYSSGCFQVYTRETTTNNSGTWSLASSGSSQCTSSGSTTNTNSGWVYYNAQQSFTIFDDINSYSGVNGLSSLLQTFSSSSTDSSLGFHFNGLNNDFNHLY